MQCAHNLTTLTPDSLKHHAGCFPCLNYNLQKTDYTSSFLRHTSVLLPCCFWGNIPQSQVFRRKRNILSQCSTTVFRAKPELTLLLTLSFLMKGSRTYRNFSVQFSLYSTNLLQQSPQDALYCKD